MGWRFVNAAALGQPEVGMVQIKSRRLSGIILTLSASLLVLAAFQNCTKMVTRGGGQTEVQGNGHPYDGKVYVQTGPQCPDLSDVHAVIRTSSATRARLEKDNCAPLAVPQDLDDSQFDVDESNPNVLYYGSRRFEVVQAPAAPANIGLVANGGFDMGISGFMAYGNPQVTVVSTGQYSGAGALRLGATFAGVEHSMPAPPAGSSFSISLYASKSGAEDAAFGCKFLDAGGSEIGTQTEGVFASAGYVFYETPCVVPAGAVQAVFFIWKDFGNGSVLADEFKIVPIP